MDWLKSLLNLINEIFVKLIKSPAQLARYNWNKWRKESDENSYDRSQRNNKRHNTK